MESHFFEINTWEFIKGILNVWWFLAKELWQLWLILIAILIFQLSFERWIKNKRRFEKSKK